MSPKEVTVLSSVEADDQPSLSSSAQIPAHAPASSASSSSQPSYVTAEQFEAMNDKWSEHFARFEALPSRGNVFTVPKTVVSASPSHSVVSSQPFIDPAARHTGLVVPPAVQEDFYKGEAKTKKKKQKSSKKDKTVPDSKDSVSSLAVKSAPGPGVYDMPEPVFQPVQFSVSVAKPGSLRTGSEEVFTGATGQGTSSSSTAVVGQQVTGFGAPTGQSASHTGQDERAHLSTGPSHDFPDTAYRDLSFQDVSDTELTGDEGSVAEEGEVSSDLVDRQDQTEDMTYRETVRSVRSFMGWNHIPVYESEPVGARQI